MTTTKCRSLVGALAILIAGTPAAAKKFPPCPDGRYVVTQGSPVITGDASPAEFVVVQNGQVKLETGCDFAPAKVKGQKTSTHLQVKWPSCGTSFSKVKLVATITGGCTRLTGKRTAKKQKPVKFTAVVSTCGDGRFDAGGGEQCGDGGGCGADATCDRCRCIAAATTTSTSLPASTTTTTSSTSSTVATTSSTSTSTSSTTSSTGTVPTTSSTSSSTVSTTSTSSEPASTVVTTTVPTTTIVTTTSTEPTTTLETTTTTSSSVPTTVPTTTSTSSSTTSSTVATQDCGNGVREGTEECDDGNDDNTDACTNACTVARCGDHIVETGVEQCDDGNAVANDGCTSCVLDPPRCGNGIVEAGETCDDGNTVDGDSCPGSCKIGPCTPGAATVNVRVSFTRPNGVTVGAIVVFLDYPDTLIGIPGSGHESSVTSGVTNFPAGFSSAPFDFDYAMRETLAAFNKTLSPGAIFDVAFKACTGAAAPKKSDFTCTVQGASTPLGADISVTGMACSVALL